MIVNRHNYEEYFILYMDNELSSEDRRLVEDFITHNPDLKDELDTLLQYKLEPDTSITFTRKEGLLKHSGDKSPISLSDYEEWLVLYTDNELTAAEKTGVEQFCAAHPAVQKELELLLQTRLQPETIVFENKAVLYRKEEKVRPLYTRWMKYAAAILLLLVGATIIILSANKKQGSGPDDILASGKENKTGPAVQQPATAAVQQNNPAATPKERDDNTAATRPAVTGTTPVQQAPAYATKTQPHPVTQDKQDMPDKFIPENNAVTNPANNAVVKSTNDNRPSNNLPLPLHNPNVNGNQPSNTLAVSNPPRNTLTTDRVTNNKSSSSDIQNASYTENNNQGEAVADAGKKNKLRGFFRKVTRTFEKRTNIDPTDGEDRLLVAGLSIKMK